MPNPGDRRCTRRLRSVAGASRRMLPTTAIGTVAVLVIGALLVDISTAVEPDRPSSSSSLSSRTTGIRQSGGRNDDGIHRSVLSSDAATMQSSAVSPGGSRARQIAWADTAFAFLRRVDCSQSRGKSASFASTESECRDVQQLRQDQLNVYVADPVDRGRLKTVLPDGVVETVAAGSTGSPTVVASHDGVVLLDPYPRANFGHLVIVFHVTLGTTDQWCEQREGILIGGE